MNQDQLDLVRDRLDAFLWPEAADSRQRRRRRAILEAATACFVARGYRRTRVEEVADAAGVAKGTVYLYYANKAELLFHAVALEKRRFPERIVPEGADTLSPSERLVDFIATSITLSRRMPLVTRLSRGDRESELVLREVDAGLLQEVNAWRLEFLMGLIGDARPDADSRAGLRRQAALLAQLVVAVCTSIELPPDEASFERSARDLAGVLVGGILSTAIRTDVPQRDRLFGQGGL